MRDSIPPSLDKKINTSTADVDPWHDWRPHWGKGDKNPSPHSLQESHHPTEAVHVRSGRGRDEYRTQRRLLDARLWDSLTPAQQDAAIAIAWAFEAMSRGLGFAASDWRRIPGSRGAGLQDQGRLHGIYIDWTRACMRAGVSHSMIIDVLCFGISCTALDRDRRVRSGSSRHNLGEGLTLYARLRGWLPVA